MSTAWAKSPAIIVFTGGALAREAGFAPFDPDGMPPELRLEDVVTKEGFGQDPARVQQFYNRRRRELPRVTPGPAHEALAVLETVRSGEVLVVTRNIDDLHERAGSRTVIHTHGELLKARCMICTNLSECLDDIAADTACPVCGNAGHLRPHVVWVGEEPLRMPSVYEALAHCGLFLAVGAPGGGEPARSFLAAARRAGARAVEFNREISADAASFDERIAGPLADTVPKFVKKLIAEA
jgi:NAD-dependent deacetylase